MTAGTSSAANNAPAAPCERRQFADGTPCLTETEWRKAVAWILEFPGRVKHYEHDLARSLDFMPIGWRLSKRQDAWMRKIIQTYTIPI